MLCVGSLKLMLSESREEVLTRPLIIRVCVGVQKSKCVHIFIGLNYVFDIPQTRV